MLYRDIIYLVLDELKLVSDDSHIVEEHVLFLVNKYRAALLHQYYKDIKKEIPQSAYQTICIDLKESSPYGEAATACDNSIYLRSIQSVPNLMTIGNTSIHPIDFFANPNITLVSKERFRFVGYNRFLKNIIYTSIGADKRLYFKSGNPQYKYLKKVQMTGIFEDAEAASRLSCDNSTNCDIMDKVFPIEENLVPILVQSVVKELSGVLYKAEDKSNNADDESGSMANFIARNAKNRSQLAIDD